jgi:hypothetical protein
MSQENSMTSTTRPAKRMKRKSAYILATVASIIGYSGLVFFSSGAPWLIWPALAVALLSVVFACFWMVSLDEVAQQAHYVSWYWGGSAGLLLSMLIFVAAVLRPEVFEPMLSQVGVSYSFAGGIVAGVVPPTFGYAIWWIVLWLRRG